MTHAGAGERLAARVLLIDQEDRLLLFRATSHASGETFWFAPGGGLEPGETHEQAARRELWEETGLEVAELGACVWHRAGHFQDLQFRERYFTLRTGSFDPRPARQTAREGYMSEDGWFRWWSLDELAAHDGPEFLEPPDLAKLLPPILDGRLPSTPIELSR